MECPQIVYREHALKRMFERNITADTVEEIIADGEIIKEYSEDKPFASYLFLGYIENRPIHVVASKGENICYIITVYEPTPEIWNEDFKTKKNDLRSL